MANRYEMPGFWDFGTLRVKPTALEIVSRNVQEDASRGRLNASRGGAKLFAFASPLRLCGAARALLRYERRFMIVDPFLHRRRDWIDSHSKGT
jgi:hypothetical protein